MHPGLFTATTTPIPTSAERFVAYFGANSNPRGGFGLDLDAQKQSVSSYLES